MGSLRSIFAYCVAPRRLASAVYLIFFASASLQQKSQCTRLSELPFTVASQPSSGRSLAAPRVTSLQLRALRAPDNAGHFSAFLVLVSYNAIAQDSPQCMAPLQQARMVSTALYKPSDSEALATTRACHRLRIAVELHAERLHTSKAGKHSADCRNCAQQLPPRVDHAA